MRFTCLAVLLSSAAAFTSQPPSIALNAPAKTNSARGTSCTAFATVVADIDSDDPIVVHSVLAPCGSVRPVLESKRPSTNKSNVLTKKPRVLFLHGEYTNERVAVQRLKMSRWEKLFDFVIPAATNDGSVCPPELFGDLGLEALKKAGQYCDTDQFYSWGCRYDLMRKDPSQVSQDLKENFQRSTVEYIKELDEAFGPFDGVMGFCEGGAALNCALGMKDDGKLDGALDSVKFFIHMAPWTTPLAGKYHSMDKSIPTLSIYGSNERIDGFLEAAEKYPSDFKGYFDQYVHEGMHTYAHVSVDLKEKITKLLETAGLCHTVNEEIQIKVTKDIVEDGKDSITSNDSDEFDTRVIALMQDIFESCDISKGSSLVDDLNVDSIFLQEMTLTFEEEFGIEIDTEVEERLMDPDNTVQDVIDIVKKPFK